MEKGSSVYTRAALGGHVTWVWRVRESVMRLTGGGGGCPGGKDCGAPGAAGLEGQRGGGAETRRGQPPMKAKARPSQPERADKE